MGKEFKIIPKSIYNSLIVAGYSFKKEEFPSRMYINKPSTEIEQGDIVYYNMSRYIVIDVNAEKTILIGSCRSFLGNKEMMEYYLDKKRERIWT